MSTYRPYPKTKPAGVEWLGDVPEHWVVKPLKIIASFNDDVLSESFGGEEEIEYVDIGSVSLETGIERTETFRFGDAPSRARRRVRDGDVIASTVRTYLKAIAPVVAPPANLIVSTGFAVIRPRKGLDSHFAKFSLQSNYFVDEVISRSTGVSYPAINASEMAAISLALPPPPEQIQIASFLDRECGKLDALQAKQQRLIELLKEKRQALISHAVTRGLDPTAKLKPSGIEWLGDVPEHGIVTRLKFEVSKIVDCPHETPKYDPDGEYLVIRTADVDRGRLDLSNAYRSNRDEFVNRTRRERLHPNDIVYGREGERWGHAALVPKSPELCLGQRMMQFRASRSIEPAFLALLLNSDAVYKQGAVDTVGATSPHVNISTIRNYYFPLPPLAEQRAIVSHLDEKCGKIDQLKAKAERGIELLKERRSALISAAVTGKIDVRSPKHATRAKLHEIGDHKQDLYHVHQAALVALNELRQRVLNGIAGIYGDKKFYTSTLISIARSDAGHDFGSVSAILAAMEADPEIAEAVKEVTPVMAEIAELEAEHADEQHVLALAEQARLAALDIAKSEAIAEVESRFATAEAAPPAEPAKPFRGRVPRSGAD